MFAIAKTYAGLSAAHQLNELPPDHKCSRNHGHDYRVTFVLTGPSLEKGMVVDYGELNTIKPWLNAMFDHQTLNETFQTNQPTAEFLAEHIYWQAKDEPWFRHLHTVIVEETPNVMAAYAGGRTAEGWPVTPIVWTAR